MSSSQQIIQQAYNLCYNLLKGGSGPTCSTGNALNAFLGLKSNMVVLDAYASYQEPPFTNGIYAEIKNSAITSLNGWISAGCPNDYRMAIMSEWIGDLWAYYNDPVDSLIQLNYQITAYPVNVIAQYIYLYFNNPYNLPWLKSKATNTPYDGASIDSDYALSVATVNAWYKNIQQSSLYDTQGYQFQAVNLVLQNMVLWFNPSY